MYRLPLIQLKNVYAGYEPNKYILKNVDFEIYPNDFIGIIGPNGGGKSTLLKIILGILKPYKGEVKYITGEPISQTIGYLPQVNQNDSSFPISALDVVLSGLMAKKRYFARYSKTDKNLAKELLSNAGLEKHFNTRIGDLSGGQRQRVYLSRAIINNPKILILDEPNTYVDKFFEGELYRMLQNLNKQMAILLVTHDIGTISSMVKTIACVNEQLHHHQGNRITDEILSTYNCPIELIAHGNVPHRVLNKH